MALNRVRISLCSADTVVSRLFSSLDTEEVELELESETVSPASAAALLEAVVAVAVVLTAAVLVPVVEVEEVVSLVASLLLELVDGVASAFRSAALSCTLEICIGNGPFTKEVLNWSPLNPH